MKAILCLYMTLVACLPMALSTAMAQSDYDVDPVTGLRMERYRAPVPQEVPDGTTLDNEAAIRLHESGEAVFIDVYPPRGMGPDPLDGHWVIAEKRQSIPGAIWLPEVGRGTLQDDALTYFKRNLRRLSQGDTATALVFFCTADCWQSWNATRRAQQLGYTNLFWYPLGSDGWLESGMPLARIYPVNFLDDSVPSDQDQ